MTKTTTHRRMPRASLLALWLAIPGAAACFGGDAATGGKISLDEAKLTMAKWIETQQIISKERTDWQQGKDVLLGRLDLVKKEIASLEAKIAEAQSGVTETQTKRDSLTSELDGLTQALRDLGTTVTGMESRLKGILPRVPEPIKEKLMPLIKRIPEDPTSTPASVAERFQNVLGILNEVNRANTDIVSSQEVRLLANGKPSQVRVMYLGLAQAYYLSPTGETGIGRPTADGWVWEPSSAISRDVLLAFEVLQGKHKPAFVGLPVRMQ